MSNDLSAFMIENEPYYLPQGDEIGKFEAAYSIRMPLLLKGPTGSGKTRFIEYMAWRLKRPLITIACHEDMTSADLVGRFLLDAEGTQWQDGPLTHAVKAGAICYLDEIVEARQDTTVVIHPLSDHRRVLPLDRLNKQIKAHPDFQLIMSYNPGYQSVVKDLKESTKQRFAALEFDYPTATQEIQIIIDEAKVDKKLATQLVRIGQATRNLRGQGLDEGASTRMLAQAARLTVAGLAIEDACYMTIINALTDDPDMRDVLNSSMQALI